MWRRNVQGFNAKTSASQPSESQDSHAIHVPRISASLHLFPPADLISDAIHRYIISRVLGIPLKGTLGVDANYHTRQVPRKAEIITYPPPAPLSFRSGEVASEMIVALASPFIDIGTASTVITKHLSTVFPTEYLSIYSTSFHFLKFQPYSGWCLF